MLVVLGSVVGASIVVGFVGPEEGFDWELASIFGTALGTTLLAVATGILAWSTSSDVRATWELARLTQADQDARQRPTVLILGAGFSGGADPQVRLDLHNVGLGPALKVMVSGIYVHPETGETIHLGASASAIAAGTGAPMVVRIPVAHPPAGGIRWESIEFGGMYTDRSLETLYPLVDARGWTNA